jgi:hypothetical protein
VLLLAIPFNERKINGKCHITENAIAEFLKKVGIGIVHIQPELCHSRLDNRSLKFLFYCKHTQHEIYPLNF